MRTSLLTRNSTRRARPVTEKHRLPLILRTKSTGYLSALSEERLAGDPHQQWELADWVQVLSFAILPSSSTRQAWFSFNFGRKNFFLAPWLPIERCKFHQVPSSTRCIGGCTFLKIIASFGSVYNDTAGSLIADPNRNATHLAL